MDKFRDVAELGRGGFGRVWRCIRVSDGVVFARKTLVLDDPGSVKRFRREVRLIERLNHRGIIRIVATHLDSSPYWFVMEHHETCLLAILPQLRLERDRALRIFDLILEAIEYAHGRNVIHRDLKPENILLSSDGHPVVTDFGLGRALDALTSRATGTGAFIGTLGYMAPEQMDHAAHADPRSDVFALGRMLYEMLSGESRHAVQDLTKLPVGLAELVQRCTLTDPERRFQTVSEVRVALARLMEQHPRAQENLSALVQRIAESNSFTLADVEKFAGLVGLCREESELLHEIAVKIPLALFAELDRSFPEFSKLLARVFAERSMGQGWSFSYTDVLGRRCAEFYETTSQPEVKGLMVAAALEVGVSHNRFYVMDLAAGLISRATEEADALAIAHAVRPFRHQLVTIEGRLTVWKLHPALGEFFLASGNGSEAVQ